MNYMKKEEKEENELIRKRAYERERRYREYLERKHRGSLKKKEKQDG